MAGTCVNGRVNPSADTKLRLFADSAGYCNRPGCHRYLFSDLEIADYHIGEMAHIIAASLKGPRADSSVGTEDRADYENLILLCPSCHTEIDKAPEIFTLEIIQKWKANHRRHISNSIDIPKYENRVEARDFVVKILRSNQAIFENLNPDLSYRENPEAEEAVVWKRKMKSQIIPNNQRILLFLEMNSHLLNDEELSTFENFKQHVDDLIERHFGENSGIASRFPKKISYILKD